MPPVEPARLRVIRPGLLTTVQDLGRTGFQRFGVSVSGAMDPWALLAGNRLVGNPDQAAGLEIMLQGPELLFETEAAIAITGGDLSPTLDGRALPMWTAVAVKTGSKLSFGDRRNGSRAYLTVAGGIDVPLVLGSRATHLRSRIGGLQGLALGRQDILLCGQPPAAGLPSIGRSVPATLRPFYSASPTLRVVAGPQHELFSPEALGSFLSGPYLLTNHSDRMGYRLTGPSVERTGASDIVSDATCLGAIQIPASGQPILLMADRPTTGGYPKIAVVISRDIPLAGQLVPGDRLRFSFVDLSEARASAQALRAELDATLPPRRS